MFLETKVFNYERKNLNTKSTSFANDNDASFIVTDQAKSKT